MKQTATMMTMAALAGLLSFGCSTMRTGEGERCHGCACGDKQEASCGDASEGQRSAGTAEVALPGSLSQEIRRRIAVLQDMLAEVESSDGSDTVEGPHAERRRDPEIIREAIERLKQGEDICTRCLMDCGAAD